MAIQTCIVEADSHTRQSLAALLNETQGLRCVGSYDSGEAALAGVLSGNPDVALVDIHLSGMSGLECISRLKSQLPKLEVLMMAAHEDRDLIFQSLRAGASGCLLKNHSPAELTKAVEQVHAGGSPMSMAIARKVVDYFHQPKPPAKRIANLTPREEEILRLLASAFLYKEIAGKLNISLNTVKTHLRVIYEKLHVQSRTEAITKFLGY